MSEEREDRPQQTEESVNEKDGGKKVSAKKLNAALEELEKAKADAAHWKNEYYKAYADTQNLRRNLEEEQRELRRYRAEGFIASLLPALDAFHLALDAPAPTKEAANYLIGFTYIYNQLTSVLESEGVKEMTPRLGDQFDPTYMNALEAVEDETYPPNHVLKVHAKGYKLHDRLIKPAMVTVTKAKTAKEENEEVGDSAPAEA